MNLDQRFSDMQKDKKDDGVFTLVIIYVFLPLIAASFTPIIWIDSIADLVFIKPNRYTYTIPKLFESKIYTCIAGGKAEMLYFVLLIVGLMIMAFFLTMILVLLIFYSVQMELDW
jgi:hypothetical protein